MSNSPSVLLDASSQAQTEISPGEKRQRWFELFLVLLMAIGGSLLQSLYLLHFGPSAAPRISSARWLIGLVHEATGLLLLGYGGSYAAYVCGSMVVQFVHNIMYGSLVTGPTGQDFFAHPGVAALPFALLNPFFEELTVRAYLMTEVLDLTDSSLLAVALSVAVQFSYHLYYGWAGAIALSFQFLIFALFYSHSRRALPIIAAHGFFDIWALFRLW